MFVCCECCVLSGRGLCDELITRPEEPYRLWCVMCDLETSRMRRPWPALGRSATEYIYIYTVLTPIFNFQDNPYTEHVQLCARPHLFRWFGKYSHCAFSWTWYTNTHGQLKLFMSCPPSHHTLAFRCFCRVWKYYW